MADTPRWVHKLMDLLNIQTLPPHRKADAILSLGRGVHDVTRKSGMTDAQLANITWACDFFLYYNTAPYLLVTGGWTENRDKPGQFTESDVQKEYALERGIPESAIFTDSVSMDTEQSLLWLKDFIQINRWTRVIVVSDWTHAPRVKLLLKIHGLSSMTEVVASLWWRDNEAYKMLAWEFAGALSLLLPREVRLKLRGYSGE